MGPQLYGLTLHGRPIARPPDCMASKTHGLAIAWPSHCMDPQLHGQPIAWSPTYMCPNCFTSQLHSLPTAWLPTDDSTCNSCLSVPLCVEGMCDTCSHASVCDMSMCHSISRHKIPQSQVMSSCMDSFPQCTAEDTHRKTQHLPQHALAGKQSQSLKKRSGLTC